jgi:hypothetical protein
MDSIFVKETQPTLPIPSEGLVVMQLFIVRDEGFNALQEVKD